MSKEKIKALLVAPRESPRIVYIEPTMKSFRKPVNADPIDHGGIEAKKLERNVYAMFNKDRFLVASLEPNRHICDDIIVGNIYVVATDDLGIGGVFLIWYVIASSNYKRKETARHTKNAKAVIVEENDTALRWADYSIKSKLRGIYFVKITQKGLSQKLFKKRLA